MSYKNGSVVGVDNPSGFMAASGVWDLNAIHEDRTVDEWPTGVVIQLLETSNVSSSSDGAWRTGTYSFTSSSGISGTTGRFYILHYGTTGFRSDVQYDNILIPTSGGDVTLDFDSSHENCQTTHVNVGTDIISAFASSQFYYIAGAGTANKWVRDSGGTGSSGTGNTMDGSNSTTGFYVYTETSGTHPMSMLLRTPEFTLGSSGTFSWREGYRGTQLASSTRELYWIGSP